MQHSVEYHTGRVEEAKADLSTFESHVQRDEEGNPINKLVLKGVEEGADLKVMAARLQEIEEKARTNGEHHKIGEIYGFSITVKTESSNKDLFQMSVNRFFVKGQEGIYYTYNNGPKLACANFVNALERIPKVIESHEKEVAKAQADIGVYTAIANGSWKKEDELRSLKTQAAELDRKIALELAPPVPEKEEVKEGEKQGQSQDGGQNTSSQGAKQEPTHHSLPGHTTMPQSPYARTEERARRPRHYESCGNI